MKILVMRPSVAGKELVNHLNSIGISSWQFSLYDFYPSISKNSLFKQIDELYKSNVIIAVSKQSIYYTNLYLQYHKLEWPLHSKYYAIGKSTAYCLYKYIKKKLSFQKKKKIVKVY